MALLAAMVLAAGIGIIPWLIAKDREAFGAWVTPAAAAAVTALVWSALLFIPWYAQDPWIWLVSIGVGALAAFVLPRMLVPRRAEHDRALLAKLQQPGRSSTAPRRG